MHTLNPISESPRYAEIRARRWMLNDIIQYLNPEAFVKEEKQDGNS